MRHSFRTTLTVWNVCVLVVSVTGAGLGVGYGTRLSLSASIDRQLQERSEMDMPGGLPGLEAPPPPEDGPRDGMGDGPSGNPPPRPPRRPMDDAFLRPSHFDPQGNEVDPDTRQVTDPAAVKGALQGRAAFTSRVVEDIPYRIYTRPLVRDGQVMGCVQFARNVSDLAELTNVQNQTLIFFVPVAVVLGLASALGLRRVILKPIVQLSDATARISAENLTQRVPVAGDDELAQMASRFNEMLSRLDSAFRELENAYEQQRRFTADASHELRTPLARIILATTRALQEGVDVPDMRKALEIASQSGTEMSGLVEQLLTLAKADAGRLEPNLEVQDVRILLAEAVDEFEEGSRVELSVPDRPLTASVDGPMVKRAVRNLIANAIRHTDGPQKTTVSGTTAGGRLTVEVRDEGAGIEPHHLPHLGERFYRPDLARNVATGGSGLGLAIVKAIAEAHHGGMRISSVVGRGTTVVLDFPTLIDSK